MGIQSLLAEEILEGVGDPARGWGRGEYDKDVLWADLGK